MRGGEDDPLGGRETVSGPPAIPPELAEWLGEWLLGIVRRHSEAAAPARGEVIPCGPGRAEERALSERPAPRPGRIQGGGSR